MEDKFAKLQIATGEAEIAMDKAKTSFDDSLRRLNMAKEALREMDEEDQKKIEINDTKLPELLDLHRVASEEYGAAKSRYETNSKYLILFKAKVGQS